MALDNVVRGLKNFRNAVILSGSILLASTSLLGQNAPMANDTIWGYGGFKLKNIENNAPVLGANVACTANYIPGDTIPDNFTLNFGSETSNYIPFNLPAFIDIYVGLPDNKILLKNAKVIPNPSMDFTVAAHGKPLSNLTVYDISGRKINELPVKYDNSRNISTIYMNLENNADGTYVFQFQTDNGVYKGKVIKNSSRKVGDLSSIINSQSWPKEKGFESVQDEDAIYDILITAEGYEDFTTEQVIAQGDNGTILYYLTPGAGIPQYQYIGGYTYEEDGSGLANVTVRLIDGSNQIIEEMLTGSDGKYVTSQPIDVGEEFSFEVGGLIEKVAFVDDDASVPDEITNPNDTLTYAYRYVMYDKSMQVPGTNTYIEPDFGHVSIMTTDGQIEGALRNKIKFYLGNSMSSAHKQGTRANYDQLEIHVGLPSMYEESPTLLNQDLVGYDPYTNPKPVGINIESGTNNTNTDNVNVITPLGNALLPAFMAEMTLTGINYLSHVHENGRAFGLHEVSWYSIMRADAPAFTNEDKVIWNLSAKHSENMYDYGRAYFTLDNITSSIPQRDSKGNIVNQNIEVNYEIVPEKETSLPSTNHLYTLEF